MHVWDTLSDLGIKRGKWAKENTWSKELRDLLNERQEVRQEDNNLNVEEEFLISGTPASRGSAQGRACIAYDMGIIFVWMRSLEL